MSNRNPWLLARCCALAGIAALAFSARAQDNERRHQAIPSEFVGRAGDCGTDYPAGSRIVTSTWLHGMGLPDNGGPNANPDPTALNDNPNKRDAHTGLLLNKNGPTADCSSAGARITGANGSVSAAFELGFDYRNGTHCGAGAPRFNVTTQDGTTHFFGCGGGVKVPAPQDPLEWTRVRFTIAQGFPPLLPGDRIRSVEIVYDEGTDTTGVEDPRGVGLSVLDNIDIDGDLITRGPESGGGGGGGGGGGDDEN
jgi:hypothetical protein